MIFLDEIAARLESLWSADEWADWLEMIPCGPRERKVAFALFALLCCAHQLDPEGDVIEPEAIELWRALEKLALKWAGFTESEYRWYLREAEREFWAALRERTGYLVD